MDDIKKKLGSRIKEIRKEKRISQEDLAFKSKLHNTYISRIELGKQSPTIEVLESIAKSLQMSLSELFYFPTTGKDKEIEEITKILKKMKFTDIKIARQLLEQYIHIKE